MGPRSLVENAAPSVSVLSPVSTLPGHAFMLVFLLMGVRDSGKHIGKRSVLLDVVPAAERPTYWGLLNTDLGIAASCRCRPEK